MNLQVGTESTSLDILWVNNSHISQAKHFDSVLFTGAHIAGIAGKRTEGRIQVIYGLDPAGPLFSLNSPNDRFSADDAVYTEGIRTNAGSNGFSEPLAHADFYPNWGST